MIWRVAADAVLVLHFAFIAFALLGGLLVWRWPRLAWLHLPAAAWAAGTTISAPRAAVERRIVLRIDRSLLGLASVSRGQ